MRIKRLHESLENNPINIDKLKKYGIAINTCCNGEYGEIYYNENDNHVFVCLGDSSPFKDEDLEYYMKEAIAVDYKSQDKIKVTIENECGPNTEKETGWKKLQKKDGNIDFFEFSY